MSTHVSPETMNAALLDSLLKKHGVKTEFGQLGTKYTNCDTADLLRLVQVFEAGLADSERRTVTADEVAAVATTYDSEYRGGIGRGDIDKELAERLANWFNTGTASPGPTEQETERFVNEASNSRRPIRRQHLPSEGR